MHSASASANGDHARPHEISLNAHSQPHPHDPNAAPLARTELLERIEEDRERHKRLRERRWVQPVLSAYTSSSTHLVAQLASLAPDPDAAADASIPSSAGSSLAAPVAGSVTSGGGPRALDIEFDNEWETTSDWNEDDDDAVAEENALCFSNADIRLSLGPDSMPDHSHGKGHKREELRDVYVRAYS